MRLTNETTNESLKDPCVLSPHSIIAGADAKLWSEASLLPDDIEKRTDDVFLMHRLE